MQEIAKTLTGKEFWLNCIKRHLKLRNPFPDTGYKHLPYTLRSEEPFKQDRSGLQISIKILLVPDSAISDKRQSGDILFRNFFHSF